MEGQSVSGDLRAVRVKSLKNGPWSQRRFCRVTGRTAYQ